MKKLVLASLLAASATLVQAQSSVTIYGLVDVGFTATNQSLVSTPGGTPTKTSAAQFGQNAQSTSRLGFRGREDLGGGTSAFFTVEIQLTPQNSNLTGANSTSAVTNRQSFVGIAQKGYGQVAIGRQYTPVFFSVAKTNANGFNNVVGDLVYLGSGSGAAGTSTSAVLTGQENGIGFTNRASNAITFQSEKFKGFALGGMYSMANQTVDSTTSVTTNQTGYGLNADYTWKKLLVTAAYQSFKAENTGSAAAIDVANGALTNATDNQSYVGAVYDFGILKAYANYVNRKITSSVDSSQFLQRTAQQIGVRGYISPKIEGWVSAGNGRLDQYGPSTPTVNFTGWQVGSNYWLSKRTNLYAIYGDTQTASSSSNAAGAGSSRNQIATGIRHTF
jgi:predicted porin